MWIQEFQPNITTGEPKKASPVLLANSVLRLLKPHPKTLNTEFATNTD